MVKFIKRTLILLIISLIAFSLWYTKVNFVFRTISLNNVYKSGLIDPNKLENFLVPNKIKTVIDLLDPGVQDALNPAKQDDIDAEDKAIQAINKKYNLNIKHINIPSPQVPTKQTLTAFFKIIDDKNNYPLLIHCYHGMGRAVIYSAIYRIEKENWDNITAQKHTRLFEFLVDSPLHHSSFAKGKDKGDFLLNYKPRRMGKEATINNMEK